MKKIISCLLCAALLTGCGFSNKEKPKPELLKSNTKEETYTVGDKIMDDDGDVYYLGGITYNNDKFSTLSISIMYGETLNSAHDQEFHYSIMKNSIIKLKNGIALKIVDINFNENEIKIQQIKQ